MRLASTPFFLTQLDVPEIFYFKHDVEASLIKIFICNPADVDNISDAILALS